MPDQDPDLPDPDEWLKDFKAGLGDLRPLGVAALSGNPQVAAGPDGSGVTNLDPLVVTGSNPHSRGFGETLADIAGKIWGLPNTLLGLGLAGVGYLAGKAAGADPQFRFGNNALQLTGIPFGTGAVTLGNVQLYGGNSTPDMLGQHYVPGLKDMTLGAHEEAHTRQSQTLGPAFIPLYFLYGGFKHDNPFESSADYYGAHAGGAFSAFTSGPLAPLRNRPR